MFSVQIKNNSTSLRVPVVWPKAKPLNFDAWNAHNAIFTEAFLNYNTGFVVQKIKCYFHLGTQ